MVPNELRFYNDLPYDAINNRIRFDMLRECVYIEYFDLLILNFFFLSFSSSTLFFLILPQFFFLFFVSELLFLFFIRFFFTFFIIIKFIFIFSITIHLIFFLSFLLYKKFMDNFKII